MTQYCFFHLDTMKWVVTWFLCTHNTLMSVVTWFCVLTIHWCELSVVFVCSQCWSNTQNQSTLDKYAFSLIDILIKMKLLKPRALLSWNKVCANYQTLPVLNQLNEHSSTKASYNVCVSLIIMSNCKWNFHTKGKFHKRALELVIS